MGEDNEGYPYSYTPENLKSSTLFGKTMAEARAKVAPFRFKLAGERIIKLLAIKPGDRVLELGSGLGLLGKAIKDDVGVDLRYFGVDLVFDSAHRSRENSIAPIQADAAKLPFNKEAFDEIISTDVLEHIPDPQLAVKEIYRVLKPGGKAFIVIADPSEGRFSHVSDHIRRSGQKTDISWWENLFGKQGFEVMSRESRKFRDRDWRKIFNLPFLARLKDKPGFACAFNPVNRPGTHILKKPAN